MTTKWIRVGYGGWREEKVVWGKWRERDKNVCHLRKRMNIRRGAAWRVGGWGRTNCPFSYAEFDELVCESEVQV